MSSSAEDRSERMRQLLQENRRRRRRPRLNVQLAPILGYQPAADDFLTLQAAQALEQTVEEQARYHQVWHRIWGDRLRGEVMRSVRELAALLEDEEAYLLVRDPLEAVRVPLAVVLRHEAEQLSPQTWLTLVSADGESGLRLEWDHLAYADEYSLTTWGRYAHDLSTV